MIVVRGLLARIAATVVQRASVATNSDSTQLLSDSFVISAPRRGTTAPVPGSAPDHGLRPNPAPADRVIGAVLRRVSLQIITMPI